MEDLNPEKLYKALVARDPRFDGRFFFGVVTTGVYCRSVCPAKPKFGNVRFYKSKAEAENAGYRPCLRCRPDLSPLSPQWRGTAAVISRALQLVEKGDQGGQDLNQIAEQLGMTDRHLRRLFEEHLGASPIAVAISRRLHLARQLLSQTQLPITDIALASGFSSLRRFNDAFFKTYKSRPRDFRQESIGTKKINAGDLLTIELPYRDPFDWDYLLNVLRHHEMFGIEVFEDGTYARHFKTGRGIYFYRVSHLAKEKHLKVELKVPHLQDLRQTVERIRQQFDLFHNPHQIDLPKKLLKKSPELAAQIQAIRVAGAFDPFEVAVATILGQLVTTEQALQNVKKLILRFGEKVQNPIHPQLTYFFPTPAVLKNADFAGLGFTQARGAAIRELARQVDSGEIELSKSCDLEKTREKLLSIKGIGPWTLEMISLRCLSDSDAFPAKDLIIERALQKFKIEHVGMAPWRAYLALAIWKTHASTLTKKRKKA